LLVIREEGVDVKARRTLIATAAIACAVAAIVPASTVQARSQRTSVRKHDVEAMPIKAAKLAPLARTTNITYHQGPIVLGTTNVYFIWYGNWAGLNSGANSILTNFAQNIGGSPYYNINTSYYNASATHISNSVNFAGSTNDNYSQGTQLSDASVQAVVTSAITSGALPKDTNALYFVLTSSDVNETSGFLTKYCGWHTNATIAGSDIKFSFVGDPSKTPTACEAQTASSPNSNPAADGMVSVMAHELEETVTDPDLNAWYDRNGAENGDKCAWTFGTQLKAPNGSNYNMTLGTMKYLIQRNWSASTQSCSLS
jgi:hypothetical protein